MCVVLASATLAAGCGQDSGEETAATTSEAAKVIPHQTTSPSPGVSGSPSSTAQLTQAQAERKSVLEKVRVTFDNAARTAVGAVSGSKLADLDIEGLDDAAGESPSPTRSPSPSVTASPSPSPSGNGTAPVWIAEVVEKDGSAHLVRIDAVSGQVIDSAPHAGQSADDKTRLAGWLARARQTPEQAAKVATDKKKGTVTSVGLDENDDSTLVWAVDLVARDWKLTNFEVDAVNGTIVHEATATD